MDDVLSEKFIEGMYGLNTKIKCGPKSDTVLSGRLQIMFPMSEQMKQKGAKRKTAEDDIEEDVCRFLIFHSVNANFFSCRHRNWFMSLHYYEMILPRGSRNSHIRSLPVFI